MVFDNRQVIFRLNIRRYISLLIYIISMGMLVLSSLFKNKVLGYDKSNYVLAISILYIAYIMYTYIRNYNFFSFSDDGDKFIFRFISTRPFDNKKKAIEIDKKDFGGFQIEKSFFFLTKKLILIVKTKNATAKYPPISISALSIKHQNLLIKSLNEFTQAP